MRLISFFGEIIPLIALFVGHELYNIFIGAALSVIAAIIIMGIAYLQEKRLAIFPLFSIGLSALLTLAAFLFGDSLFIKIQPTIFNLSFGALLLGGYAMRVAMMKRFFGAQFFLTDEVWLTLTLRWGCFMLVLAAGNEWAWRTLTDDGWVTFKIFIIAPATALFMAAQIPITLRGRIKPDAS